VIFKTAAGPFGFAAKHLEQAIKELETRDSASR